MARLYADKIAVNDDDAYLGRYDKFDFRSRFGALVDRVDFPRLITVLEFERIVTEHAIAAERVLMLNGGPEGDPELAYLDHRHVDRADYEQDPARFDLHSPQFDRSDYDFALLSQTLEHVYDPGLAVAQLFAALAPGGYVWASVPTVSQQHQMPHHFTTGFTPIGFACLFAHAGFEVVEIGQWGNMRLRFTNLRARYLPHLLRFDPPVAGRPTLGMDDPHTVSLAAHRRPEVPASGV